MGIFDKAYAQSATTGLFSVISNMPRPASGTSRYKVSLSIKNGRGQSEDPDNVEVFFRASTSAGAEFGGGTRFYDANTGGAALADSTDGTFDHATNFWVVQDASVREGVYEAFLQLDTGDAEGPIIIEAAWYEQGRSQSTSVVTRIGDAADMDTVSTNVDAVLVDTGTTIPGTITTLQGTADAIETDTQDLQSKVGSPVSTLAADIATVDANVDAVLVDTGTTIPGVLGTPAGASVSADIATVDTVVDGIQADLDNGTDGLGALKALIDALQTDLGDFSSNTNLQSLLAVLGAGLDNAGIALAVLASAGIVQVYETASSGAGTFTLTEVTGLSKLFPLDDFYNDQPLLVIGGPRDGDHISINDYTGATGVVTHDGATVGDGNIVLFTVPGDRIGTSDIGSAASGYGNAGDTVHQVLRKIGADIAAVAAGSGTQSTSIAGYPWSGSGVLSAHPTQKEESAGSTTQSISYAILSKKTVSLPEGTDATIKSIILHLKWTGQGTDGGGGGNGDTKFMMSPATATETEGAAPSVNAFDISSEFEMSTSKVTREVSGNITDAASTVLTSGGFYLLLCGKVDDNQDTANGTIYDDSSYEVSYEL